MTSNRMNGFSSSKVRLNWASRMEKFVLFEAAILFLSQPIVSTALNGLAPILPAFGLLFIAKCVFQNNRIIATVSEFYGAPTRSRQPLGPVDNSFCANFRALGGFFRPYRRRSFRRLSTGALRSSPMTNLCLYSRAFPSDISLLHTHTTFNL